MSSSHQTTPSPPSSTTSSNEYFDAEECDAQNDAKWIPKFRFSCNIFPLQTLGLRGQPETPSLTPSPASDTAIKEEPRCFSRSKSWVPSQADTTQSPTSAIIEDESRQAPRPSPNEEYDLWSEEKRQKFEDRVTNLWERYLPDGLVQKRKDQVAQARAARKEPK